MYPWHYQRTFLRIREEMEMGGKQARALPRAAARDVELATRVPGDLRPLSAG